MANLNLPSSAASTSSAATVVLNGAFSSLRFMSLTANVPIFIRTDGVDAVAAADYNWAVGAYPVTIPVKGNDAAGTTTFSVISASNATLAIWEPQFGIPFSR